MARKELFMAGAAPKVAQRKKKMSRNEAAGRLAGLLQKHLSQFPQAEQEKRIKRAEERVSKARASASK